MLLKALSYPKHRKTLNARSEKGRLYQLLVENDAEFKPSEYNHFYDSLYTIYAPHNIHNWFSFEFHANKKAMGIYAWLSGDGKTDISKDFLQSNVNAIHPYAEVHEVTKENDYAKAIRFQDKKVDMATLELEKHFMFPLEMADKERISADMMNAIASSMQNLEDDEEVIVQFILRPAPYNQFLIAQHYFDYYQKFGYRPTRLKEPYQKFNPYIEHPKAFFNAMRIALLGKMGKDVQHTSEQMNTIKKKIESGVLFDLSIRVLTASDSQEKANDRMKIVLSSFSPATERNRLRPFSQHKKEKFLKKVEERRVSTYANGNYVVSAELANLLHFPSKNIPNVLRLRSKRMPVGEGIYTYPTLNEAKNAYVVGKTSYRGRMKYIGFEDIRDMQRGTYCIGSIGSGKTTLLLSLALQVAMKNGICLTDIKDSQMIRDFLKFLPKSEWSRIVLVDLSDDEYYVPLNILKQEGYDVFGVSEMVVDTFMKSFSDGSIREHSADLLFKIVAAVVAGDKQNPTIMECYRLLTDEEYLDYIIAALENDEDFVDLYQFWSDYKEMKPKERMNHTKAIRNKLAKFVQNKRPRYTTCQRGNILENIRQLMDNGNIVLLNIPIGKLGNEILKFYCSLFLNFIGKAAFSRENIEVTKRRPYLVFLDEFHNFISQKEELETHLSMSRSLGLGYCLSHQSIDQIPSQFLGIVRDNTFSQFSLTIGPDSAKKVKDMFPGVSEDDLKSQDNYEAYGLFKKLNPKPFTMQTLPLTELFKENNEEDIQKFLEGYKRMHYAHISSIRKDINERYRMVGQQQNLHNNDIVVKGNASGKVMRRYE